MSPFGTVLVDPFNLIMLLIFAGFIVYWYGREQDKNADIERIREERDRLLEEKEEEKQDKHEMQQQKEFDNWKKKMGPKRLAEIAKKPPDKPWSPGNEACCRSYFIQEVFNKRHSKN